MCESFLCVSSQTRSNYCSAECFTTNNCPDGFVCQTLQPVGAYATTKFCLLQKVCNSDNDCPKGSFFLQQERPDVDRHARTVLRREVSAACLRVFIPLAFHFRLPFDL